MIVYCIRLSLVLVYCCLVFTWLVGFFVAIFYCNALLFCVLYCWNKQDNTLPTSMFVGRALSHRWK